MANKHEARVVHYEGLPLKDVLTFRKHVGELPVPLYSKDEVVEALGQLHQSQAENPGSLTPRALRAVRYLTESFFSGDSKTQITASARIVETRNTLLESGVVSDLPHRTSRRR